MNFIFCKKQACGGPTEWTGGRSSPGLDCFEDGFACVLEGASDVVDWCDSCNSSSDNSNKKDEYISSSCEFFFLFCQIYIECVKKHLCFCITVLTARLAGKLSRPICLSILSCENISIKNTLFGENISINDRICICIGMYDFHGR